MKAAIVLFAFFMALAVAIPVAEPEADPNHNPGYPPNYEAQECHGYCGSKISWPANTCLETNTSFSDRAKAYAKCYDVCKQICLNCFLNFSLGVHSEPCAGNGGWRGTGLRGK